MKKILYAIVALAAVSCLSGTTAHAQLQSGGEVYLDKYVTGPDKNGQYLITLETYATGSTVKKESSIVSPVNLVFLLDVTKAMWTNQQTTPMAEAVEAFLHAIPAPTDATKQHNIQIIPFADRVLENYAFYNASVADSTTIKNTLISVGTSGSDYSNPEFAFLKAAQVLAGTTNGYPTMVLYFTSTSRKTNGDSMLDVDSCLKAVNMSYVLKQKGDLSETKTINIGGTNYSFTKGLNCTVFSIANFKRTKTATDGEENNVKHFLNFVSSVYPDKWVNNTSEFTSTTEGIEEPNTTNYHQYTAESEEIAGMFEKIQEEVVTPSILIDTTSVVRDILTPDFKLPDGIPESTVQDYVQVYTQDCIYSGGPSYTYSFDPKTCTNITNSVEISLGDARTINVTGYNFAEHYCGYDEHNGGKTGHAGGQKLIITILIEPVADYQGGYSLPTNTENSGIYTEEGEVINNYPVPDVDFPSIGIIKYGLNKGESATFTVQRIKNASGVSILGSTPFMIILTGDGSGKPAYAILKDLPEGTYRVAESMWSWTYEITEVTVKDGEGQTSITPNSGEASVTTQILAKDQTTDWPSDISETAKCVLFTFTNTKKTGTDPTINTATYAESIVKNKFKGGGVKNPSATTINSKTQSSE